MATVEAAKDCEIPTEQEVSHTLAITPDGRRAFVAHALADTVSILDLETLETTGTIAVGAEPD